MNWKLLRNEADISEIVAKSFQQPVLIYKHSTRCSLSSVTQARLERNWQSESLDIECYFLDLIAFRGLSNLVADKFQVPHQSPQILVISQGVSFFDCSHMSISHGVLKEVLQQLALQKSN